MRKVCDRQSIQSILTHHSRDRPINVDELAWSAEKTRNEINQLLDRFPLVDETPQILHTWLGLVTENKVLGKRTHDARIVSLMKITDIHHILTLNPKDFIGFSGIVAVQPKEILKEEADR